MVVVVVGDEVVGAEGVVVLPVSRGAVAVCGVEDVAACGGGVEAGDDGRRGGFDAVGVVGEDGDVIVVGAEVGSEGAVGWCGDAGGVGVGKEEKGEEFGHLFYFY